MLVKQFDALVITNAYVEIANSQFTLNMQQAIAFIKKMEELAIERMICYNGEGIIKILKVNLNA